MDSAMIGRVNAHMRRPRGPQIIDWVATGVPGQYFVLTDDPNPPPRRFAELHPDAVEAGWDNVLMTLTDSPGCKPCLELKFSH